MDFNPPVKEFLEKNPNVGMLRFGWAVYWRWAVLILAIEAIVAVCGFLLLFIFKR